MIQCRTLHIMPDNALLGVDVTSIVNERQQLRMTTAAERRICIANRQKCNGWFPSRVCDRGFHRRFTMQVKAHDLRIEGTHLWQVGHAQHDLGDTCDGCWFCHWHGKWPNVWPHLRGASRLQNVN